MNDAFPIERRIRLEEVMRQTGLGKTTIYARERAGDFPKHIKEGATSLWFESEVQAYIVASKAKARAA